MNHVTRWFWLVVVAQATFLLSWAGWHEYVRTQAPVIRLKTRPVDPQDLLRGDFMVLRYEIGDVALPIPPGAPDPLDKEYWIVLEPRDGFHAAVSAAETKPALKPGQIAVRGRATWRNGRRVAYGIEDYFVPEGKGSPRFTTIEVEAAVSPTHRLYLKRVLLDGKPYP